MQEKSPLASEVINLRIMKDKSKSMQMHLDAITEDCVGIGLQSSEEQTSRNISLDKTPSLWYGVKLLKLLEADCLLQATRFLLFISDLLISSLLFDIANPITTWQLSAWKLLLLLQATSFPEAESFKEDGCCQWIPLYEVTCVHVQKCSHTCWLCAGVLQDIAIILGTPFHLVFHVAWGIVLCPCQNAWLYLTYGFLVILQASICL